MKYDLNHIYCADCYEAIKEIPNKSIDLIYTDIPCDFETNGGIAKNLLTAFERRLTNATH